MPAKYDGGAQQPLPDNTEQIPLNPNNNIQNTDHSTNDDIKRKLNYFFMDPRTKWKYQKRCPWKLVLWLIKVALITAQVLKFADQRSGTMEYFERNKLALKHLFLKNWDATYETMPYPPAVGDYAVYTKQDLFSRIEHIMQQYYKLPKIAIGTFVWERNDTNGTESVPPPIEMCKTSYNEVSIFENMSFIIDPDVHTECLPIKPIVYENKTVSYDIEEYLKEKNVTISFNRMIKIELTMALTSYHLDLLTKDTITGCFKTKVFVLFDNTQRNGQTLIDLTTLVTEIECDGKILSEVKDKEIDAQITLDSVVIGVVLISFLISLASLVKAQILRVNVIDKLELNLSCWETLRFVNLWEVLFIINDILTLVGSSDKIRMEKREFCSLSENYDTCSIFLGVGSLLAWCGLLRYLRFFPKHDKYQQVLKFVILGVILYLGFMFCGWVVLGPYHLKFRRLSTTSECLFSMINGDDMFVTFSATETMNDLVWYFSRIYLYTFISALIYVVLNLFLAVVLDTYQASENMVTVILKKRHSLQGLNLIKLIEKIRVGRIVHVDELASFQQGKKLEDLSVQEFKTCFKETLLSDESLEDVLQMAGRPVNLVNCRLAVHEAIHFANEFGQPKGQQLHDAVSKEETESNLSKLIDECNQFEEDHKEDCSLSSFFCHCCPGFHGKKGYESF